MDHLVPQGDQLRDQRKHSGQKNRDKERNNDLQNTTQKTKKLKIEQHEPH